MYAEKIFNDKVYRNITAVDFPYLMNSHYVANISIEKGHISITPRETSDIILLNYHDLPDRLYELASYIKTIKTRAPESIPRPSPTLKAPATLPTINFANRLRKLNYIADDFFIDYYDALEEVRKSLSGTRIVNRCGYYTRGFSFELPFTTAKLTIRIRIHPALPDYFVFTLQGKRAVFRVAGKPINACAAFSLVGDSSHFKHLLLHFTHMSRRHLSTYQYRKLVKTIRLLEVEFPLPKSKTSLFYKTIPIIVYVYEYHDRYDPIQELHGILAQKESFPQL